MGYRLDIHKIENQEIVQLYYGTKLYGYVDEEKFLSFMYLISIGKLAPDTYFDYGTSCEFALNRNEFTIFCQLYNIDMNKYYQFKLEKDGFIQIPEIQKELSTSINDKNQIYIIGWC